MERQRKQRGQSLTKGGTDRKILAGNLNIIHIRYIFSSRGYGVAVVNGVDQEGLAGKKRNLIRNSIFRAKI
jgi:hypothetical protein